MCAIAQLSPRASRGRLTPLLGLAVGLLGGCDGEAPAPELVDAPAAAAFEALTGSGERPDEAADETTDVAPVARRPRLTAREPVSGMAHDVQVLGMALEGEAVADLARVGDELVIAVGLRHGFRLERWSLAEGAPPTRRGVTTHDAVDATPPALAPLPDGSVLVAWNEAGTLRAVSMAPDASGALIGIDDALAPFLATETHALVGAPVLTATGDSAQPILACAQETARGLICGFMSAAGGVDAWQPIGKLRDYAPIAVEAVDDGFVGLAGKCLDERCAAQHLVTLHLDGSARPDRRRGARALAKVQGKRPIVAVRAAGGLFVSARRTNAQLTTAWHVSRGPNRELDGTFSRVIGAIFLDAHGDGGETWLLEESPLTMRGGFPVGLVRPSRWSLGAGREEAVGWPADAHEALPGAPGQRILAREGVVGLVPAHRSGEIELSVLLLSPNDAPRSAPVPREDARPRKRRTRR